MPPHCSRDAARAQLVGERDQVDALAAVEQREQRLVDPLVGGAVEVLGAQQVLDGGQRLPVQEDRPEGRELRLVVVGRDAVAQRARGSRPGRARRGVAHDAVAAASTTTFRTASSLS